MRRTIDATVRDSGILLLMNVAVSKKFGKRAQICMVVGAIILLGIFAALLLNGRYLAYEAWMATEYAFPKQTEQLYHFAIRNTAILGERNALYVYARYGFASWLYEKGRFQQSTQILNSILGPQFESEFEVQTRLNVHYLLGCDYWHELDFVSAAEHFGESYKLSQQSRYKNDISYLFNVQRWRIRSLLRSSQWDAADQAAKDLKELIAGSGPEGKKIEPRLAALFVDVYQAESKFDELDESLHQKLSGKNETSAKAAARATNLAEQKLGWVALRRHKFAESKEHFDLALKVVPDDTYSLWNRGLCNDLLNQLDLALKDYRALVSTKSFSRNPDNSKREVADLRQYCTEDYFAAEACRLHWGRWPKESMPLKVFIPTGDGKACFNLETKNQIVKCLDEWCAAVPEQLSYRLVPDQQSAQLVFNRENSSFALDDSGRYDGMTFITTDGSSAFAPSHFQFVKIKLVEIDMRTTTQEKLDQIHGLFLHEIGHAIGLRTHSPNPSDVMFMTNLTSKLTTSDLSTIQKVYAPDAALRARAEAERISNLGNSFYAQYGEAMYCIDDHPRGSHWRRAFQLFKLAYFKHFPEAATQIGLMYKTGNSDFPPDYSESRQWLEKAIEAGDFRANEVIANLYADGLGVAQDKMKAVEYYRAGAIAGDSNAQRRLGFCYMNGFGIDRDYFQSLDWFKKAAKQNDGEALRRVGDAYEKGLGVKQNYTEAFSWYQLGAMRGNAVSQSWLGYCYQHGRAVPADKAQARFWYRKAAANGDEYAIAALKRLGN